MTFGLPGAMISSSSIQVHSPGKIQSADWTRTIDGPDTTTTFYEVCTYQKYSLIQPFAFAAIFAHLSLV